LEYSPQRKRRKGDEERGDEPLLHDLALLLGFFCLFLAELFLTLGDPLFRDGRIGIGFGKVVDRFDASGGHRGDARVGMLTEERGELKPGGSSLIERFGVTLEDLCRALKRARLHPRISSLLRDHTRAPERLERGLFLAFEAKRDGLVIDRLR